MHHRVQTYRPAGSFVHLVTLPGNLSELLQAVGEEGVGPSYPLRELAAVLPGRSVRDRVGGFRESEIRDKREPGCTVGSAMTVHVSWTPQK